MAKTSSKRKFTSNRSTQNATEFPSNKTHEDAEDLNIEFFHLHVNDSIEKGISIRQQRGPCACLSLNCGCCAGMETQKFKRKRML